MGTTESSFRVLIFPWLAHGHISPFLELAKKLCKRKFHIYFCSTAINLSYIKENFKESLSDFSIELVELHLPYVAELPPEYHTTKGLPPNLMPTLISSFQLAKPSFATIINSLKPDLLIYDGFQSWAPSMASLHRIPSVFFVTSGAATMSYFHHLLKNGFNSSTNTFPFPEIYIRGHEMRKLRAPPVKSHVAAEELSPLKCFELSSEIVLIKSCKAVEEKYLDYLSLLSGKKMVPIGPLIHDSNNDEENHSGIIKWLNNKDQSSVVFVSFGSEYFLSEEEREEIAWGLELSNANFIWVVRFPVGKAMSIEKALPAGFLNRVQNRGIVIDGWAPQAKILQHSSTGGFVSHCGWGSTMESLYYGIPLIAMPMNFDQPTNARLMVEIGVGIEVMRDPNGQRKREEIAKVINDVILEKTGEEMRGKARDFSRKLRIEGEKEIDEAIEKLRHICINNM